MLYFGAVAVILGAYMIWREYAFYLDGELLSCRSFLRALVDYREKIKCYMELPSDWVQGYRDEYLAECGFFDKIRSGVNFGEAYATSKDLILITDGVDDALTSCFDRLGDGYLDTELEALGIAIDKLTREEERLVENLSKRRKATGAVLGACALGIVILVI